MIETGFEKDFLPCLKISSSGISGKIRQLALAERMSAYFSQFSCCAFAFDRYFYQQNKNTDIIKSGNVKINVDNENVLNLMNDEDILVIGGVITKKLAPYILELYNNMPETKWVLAIGACTSAGGPFKSFSTLNGLSELMPIDVYVPGCPPSAQEVVHGLNLISERIKLGVMASQIKLDLR